jgi:hypothetical protein
MWSDRPKSSCKVAKSRKTAGNGVKPGEKSELFLMKFSRARRKFSAAIQPREEKKLPAASAAQQIPQQCGQFRRKCRFEQHQLHPERG